MVEFKNNKTEIDYLKIKVKQLEDKVKQSCKPKPSCKPNNNNKPKQKPKYNNDSYDMYCGNIWSPVTRDEFRMRRRL